MHLNPSPQDQYINPRRSFFQLARDRLRIITCWGLAGCSCTSSCLPLTSLLNDQELEELKSLYLKSGEPIHPGHPYHEALLGEYWTGLFPNEPIPPIPSWKWILAGFQSSSPWTDFRGGGLLALELMVFFIRNYTLEVRRLAYDCLPQSFDPMEASLPAKTDVLNTYTYYPYAASFVNAEFSLVSFLRVNSDLARHFSAEKGDMPVPRSTSTEPLLHRKWKRVPSMPSGSVTSAKGTKRAVKGIAAYLARYPYDPGSQLVNEAFANLFSLCCLRMHKEWMALAKYATLLDFGLVISKTMSAVARAGTNNKILREPSALRKIILCS